MKKRYKNSFIEKIREAIGSLPDGVFLRKELGNVEYPRQLTRALSALMENGEIIKLGYGVYAKAEKSNLDGAPIIKIGFTMACLDALDKLGVRWEPGKAVREYNEGKSTQVPARFIVKLKDRYRGELSYGKRVLKFEGNINAK